MKLIIDTDPGTDDALAISAANGAEIDILGLTVVGGNVPLELGIRNSLSVLDFLGREDIDVYPGASRPLEGEYQYAYDYHGPDGLLAEIDSSNRQKSNIQAVDFITESVRNYPNEVTLLALGPLTNIANCLRDDPEIVNLIDKIIIMGGAFQCEGNVSTWAEFNIFDDPVAAGEVFSIDIPMYVVGLDVCNAVSISRKELPWPLYTNGSRGQEICKNILSSWFSFHNDKDIYPLCDPLALISCLYPEVVEYVQSEITVVQSGIEIGRTLMTSGIRNINIAKSVDGELAKNRLTELLESSG